MTGGMTRKRRTDGAACIRGGFAFRRVCGAFLLILGTGIGLARAAEEAPPDLPALLREALANHPNLHAASAQIRAAEARVGSAKAAARPTLDSTLGYIQLQDDPSFTVPSMGTLVFGETDNRQASLTARLPLFTGGRIGGMTRQAEAGLEGAVRSRERLLQQVARDVTMAYYDVLKARGLAGVAGDRLASLEAQRDAIRRMVEQGVATRLELLRAETAVSAAREGVIGARNGESVAVSALTTAMGRRADPAFRVAVPPAGAEGEPPGELDPSLAVEAPGASPLPATADDAVREARDARPEVAGLRAARAGAEAAVQVAESGRKPSVGVYTQYDASRPTYMPHTGNWSAGVQLTMSVFDGGATRSETARAKAGIAETDAAMEALQNGISLQVRKAFLDVESARLRAETARQGVVTAEEGFRLVRLGYQNGVNTLTDVLAAQAELTGARTQHLTALYDVRAAETELRYAMGRAF